MKWKYILILFIPVFSFSQWQSDIRLTNNSASSYTSWNNAWCVAANGNFVHTVWYDERDGNDEIYYKRSTDGGIIWGADIRLTNAPFESWFPSLIVTGLEVHIVWQDYRDGNYEIYYKRSTDGGINWGGDVRLTNNSGRSRFAAITIYASMIHIIWEDNRDGNDELYYKRSTDGGLNWGTDMRLTNNAADSRNSSISASASVLHAIWEDTRDGNSEIYYKRSTDGGLTWGIDTRLTNNSLFSGTPVVLVNNSIVHVVYQDNNDGNDEIYYKRSTDAGTTWGIDTRLTNNSLVSNRPSISISGSLVHIVWIDSRDGNSEIYYKCSTDGGTTWGADNRLTNNASPSERPSVAVSSSTIHVVWHDNRDGNYEIYYKRDPTGNPTGITNINSQIPMKYKLDNNFPNPFNPVTNIKFDIASKGNVKLVVFDIQGCEIMTVINQELQPGSYKVDWDASNYPSGVYFYKLDAGDFVETKKMVLVK